MINDMQWQRGKSNFHFQLLLRPHDDESCILMRRKEIMWWRNSRRVRQSRSLVDHHTTTIIVTHFFFYFSFFGSNLNSTQTAEETDIHTDTPWIELPTSILSGLYVVYVWPQTGTQFSRIVFICRTLTQPILARIYCIICHHIIPNTHQLTEMNNETNARHVELVDGT